VIRPKLRTDLIVREVDDELLIYDPRTGETVLLNGTAAAIAELCDGTGGPAAIVADILGMVEADPAVVQADVERVIRELDERGLMEDAT
jgi:PqqD family protein of HPr-rel-A system